MIEFLIPCLVFMTGLVFILLRKNTELKKDLREKDIIYVDKSGITENPPVNFIETWKGKTLNIKFDKYVITIGPIPPLVGIKYMEKLAVLFTGLKELVKYKPKGRFDKIRYHAQYMSIYNAVVEIIYRLSFQFVDNKRKYRKALYKKSKKDILFIIDVCEQIFDYWVLVKKKMQILGKGQTLRMGGGTLSWDYINLDGNGTISLKPRFGTHSSISLN